MNEEVTIEVERREATGKSPNARLRRADSIPAVVYGGAKDPIAIQVPRKTLINIFKDGGSGEPHLPPEARGTEQSRHGR
ncbi:MAG: hypothetical protein R2862_04780 [Thermoanaerobaculia bacterium]